MLQVDRAQIKQWIYNLRLYKFHAGKLLEPANWSDTYFAALQNLANDHNVTMIEAAKIVYDFAVKQRDTEIQLLRNKLGELPSKTEDFKNIALFPFRNSRVD